LTTADGQIRQFAFDGNPATFFASTGNPGLQDHFTLTFDQAAAVASITVTTGKPAGGDTLEAGTLEGSADGTTFEALAPFVNGVARATVAGRALKGIRIRPTAAQAHPLAISEIAIDSSPRVQVFRYPVEFILDVSDAPEMRAWGERAVRVCERNYAMVCDELTSDGFRPLTIIRMTLKNDYNGVAAAGGGRIVGSVKYFKSHPDDVGAMVHETVHCVQNYRGRGNPGWLVEGVADYIRFYRYEPRRPGPLTPERAKYDGSYRTTAAFLAYLTEAYDREIVKKLNAAMRQSRYKPEIWKDLTGKTVEELGRAWQASLAR
jgi:hypothetical protein